MSGDPPPPEGFDDLVSGLAGGLYAELRRLVSVYGESSVSSLVPLAVSTLESLQDVCAQGREQQAELGSARQEAQLALAQLQSERERRKEAEERFLELEDSFEQDRMSLKWRIKSALTQYRQMEVKARSYSDTILQLEEEKRAIEKEHQRLQQKHKAALQTVCELRSQIQLEASRCPTPTSPNIKRSVLMGYWDYRRGSGWWGGKWQQSEMADVQPTSSGCSQPLGLTLTTLDNLDEEVERAVMSDAEQFPYQAEMQLVRTKGQRFMADQLPYRAVMHPDQMLSVAHQ
ncbi:JNK-interacting protein-like [Mobula birostris]|uniref:JNK-interacting protein-like n=1 Tax=Mobula birostris TaxID=1983395 RepID=UPI003B28AE1A